MAREIIIDEDTLVGYSFPTGTYYVTNKNTTTTRTTKEEIKQVLNIVAPSNQITLEDLQTLSTTLETLYSLSYTYADNSAYIKTIQLNTYEENPLTLDLDLKKLYIMNSNLIFDLTLNEALEYRVPYLIDYYEKTLGLQITTQQMSYLYTLLTSYYSPTYYNQITKAENTNTLYYTNIFNLSNYNNSLKETVSCTYNPNDIYTGNTIADISHINQDTRTIQLTSSIPSILEVEDKIIINNATTIIDSIPYSLDGTYTITGLDQEANIIQVAETLPVSYDQEYLTLYLITSQTNIVEINRENFTITLSSIPNTIKIGDKIYVTGTQQTLNEETVSADGEYTIANMTGNSLIVQEQIPINYTGEGATVYKELPIAYIQSISNNVVTLFSAPTTPINVGDKVSINSNIFVVQSISSTVITLPEAVQSTEGNNYVVTLTNSPDPYTLEFAHLQERIQEPLVSITIANSNPFIVDNFYQCEQYLALSPQFPILPSSIEDNIGQRVPMSMSMLGLEATCKGLYSDNYTESL